MPVTCHLYIILGLIGIFSISIYIWDTESGSCYFFPTFSEIHKYIGQILSGSSNPNSPHLYQRSGWYWLLLIGLSPITGWMEFFIIGEGRDEVNK